MSEERIESEYEVVSPMVAPVKCNRGFPVTYTDPLLSAHESLRQTKPDEACARTERLRLIEQGRSILAPRDAAVFFLRFVDQMTFEEIGKEIGVTRERARQILCRAARIVGRSVFLACRRGHCEINP